MTFGEKLRQQRQARGIDIRQVADETRINARYLEALETGNFKEIPGQIFARSFARQYARHVGLDEALIEDDLQAAFRIDPGLEILQPKFYSDRTEPVKSPSRPSILDAPVVAAPASSFNWDRVPVPSLTLMAVLAGCALLYMGWQRVVLGRGASTGPLIQEKVSNSATSGVPTTKLPTGEALPRPDVASNPSAAQFASAVTAGGQAPPVASSVELQVPAANGNAGMKIALVASQQTWVSITANGRQVFSGVLEANTTRELSGVENAKMVIGNAGGVEVLADGRPIGPIGPEGQVRVVLLTPSSPPQILKAYEERPAPALPKPVGADPDKVAL